MSTLSMSSLIERLRDPRQHFPDLLDPHRPKHALNTIHGLSTLAQGLVDQQLPNATWQELKTSLGRALQEAWSRCVLDPFAVGGRWKQHPEDVQDFLNLMPPDGFYALAQRRRQFEALARAKGLIDSPQPVLVAIRSFFEQMGPLAHVYDTIQPFLVKRRPKTDEERAAAGVFVPPAMDPTTLKQLKDALESVTIKHYQSLVHTLLEMEWNHLNGVLQTVAQRSQQPDRQNHRWLPHNHSSALEWQGHTVDDARPMLKLNTPTILRQAAERDANIMRSHFLQKNLVKLTSILHEKTAPLRRIEVVGSAVSYKGLTGTFEFTFADGTKFQAINSVVHATSVRQKKFLRYPLTFHQAQLSNGERHAKVSEAWMNTVFLGKPALDSTLSAEHEAHTLRDVAVAPAVASRRLRRMP